MVRFQSAQGGICAHLGHDRQTAGKRVSCMAFQLSTINHLQSLDDLQYNQMIMALHRPSSLIPRIPSSFVDILYEAANVSVELYSHYSLEKHLLVNWVHLQQIYTSCATLVYCFCEYQARDDLTEFPQEQILSKIDQCERLLARFGPPWPATNSPVQWTR